MPDAKTVDLTYAGWMGARFSSQGPEGPPGEPQAEQHVLARTFHGVSLNDEFDWLKAGNWREVMRDPLELDPTLRAYLQAENDYCERALGETAGLQQTLFAEMKARIKEDDSTVPEPDGPYAYYVRYREGGQHPLLCRQPRRSSVAATGLKVVEEMNEEQLLLDGMRSPKERRFSGSASQSIRPTTGCWCG
jgi:oligopeptidase B